MKYKELKTSMEYLLQNFKYSRERTIYFKNISRSNAECVRLRYFAYTICRKLYMKVQIHQVNKNIRVTKVY